MAARWHTVFACFLGPKKAFTKNLVRRQKPKIENFKKGALRSAVSLKINSKNIHLRLRPLQKFLESKTYNLCYFFEFEPGLIVVISDKVLEGFFLDRM